MRTKLSLFALAAVAAATSAVLLGTGTATASHCPPGFVDGPTVKPIGVRTCVPGQQCDPRPCDPTAAPNQD